MNKPLSEYPRPQLKRDSYICLNGYWEYAFRTIESIPDVFDGQILVPFSPEVEKSGVNKVITPKDYLFYRLKYEIPKEFIKDKKGNVKAAVLISLEPKKDEKTGRMNMVPVEGSEKEIPADLVLIAAGFLGSEQYVTDSFGVELDGRTNVKTAPGEHATSKAKVYVAGDMHRGQSLVVWALSEGMSVAGAVDRDLMGYANL